MSSEAAQELLGFVYVHGCAGASSKALTLCSGTASVSREWEAVCSCLGVGLAGICATSRVPVLPSSSSQPLSSTEPCFLSTVALHFLLMGFFFNGTGSERVGSLLLKLFFSSSFGVLFSDLTSPALLQLSLHKPKCNSDAFSYENAF